MNRIRQRKNPVLWQAGALSLLVHGVFFALLVMTFSWKTVQPMQVTEVELWQSLPVQKVEPKPEPPKPEPVIEPKPEPKPEPSPPPTPKAEIQVKAKPPVKPRIEKPKPDPRLKAKEEEKRIEAFKRAMLAEDDPALAQKQEIQQIAAARNAQVQAAASSGALDAAKAKIIAKIKRYVNPQVCGSGKPVLEFSISLMPTGDVIGNPLLQKSSGIPACDQAVDRAIRQAQPLPVPSEPELFSQLRELNLKFRPNDDN